MAGTVVIQEALTQLPQGNVNSYTTIPPNSSNEYSAQNIKLSSGANTINVPTWASGCIIRPDPTNAVQITYKGVSGDTGTPMSLTQPWLITFPATPPASFVLTAASGPTTYHNIEFF